MGQRGQAKKKLTVPYCPGDSSDGGENPYIKTMETLDLKFVAEYSGLSFAEIMELNSMDWFLLLREAMIYRLSQSEAGTAYLRDCWYCEQTEPDMPKLKQSGLLMQEGTSLA